MFCSVWQGTKRRHITGRKVTPPAPQRRQHLAHTGSAQLQQPVSGTTRKSLRQFSGSLFSQHRCISTRQRQKMPARAELKRQISL